MLKNEYFVTIIGFDTPENERSENLKLSCRTKTGRRPCADLLRVLAYHYHVSKSPICFVRIHVTDQFIKTQCPHPPSGVSAPALFEQPSAVLPGLTQVRLARPPCPEAHGDHTVSIKMEISRKESANEKRKANIVAFSSRLLLYSLRKRSPEILRMIVSFN